MSPRGTQLFHRAHSHSSISQSGDSPDIPLVKMTDSVSEVADRWKVVEKMNLTTQYAFSGDFTGKLLIDHHLLAIANTPHLPVVEALEKAVTEVSKFDGGMS